MQTAKAQMTIRKLLAVVAVFAGLSSLSPAVSAQTPSQFISFNAPGAVCFQRFFGDSCLRLPRRTAAPELFSQRQNPALV
jgi:hypothetical protein